MSDGLGDRLLMFDNSDAPSLELLRFRQDFAQLPGFENALRERVQSLGQFRHPAFAPVRSVKRLEPDDDLALISNFTPGKRLSEVLHHARGPAFAATLIRQLAPALVLLQQQGVGVSHGVLNPDRIVVSRGGRLTIVEHVVGPAIDTLNLPLAKLASMGIALPPAADGANPRLDVATDWYQLGLVAVSVLIGRPVTASELPQLESLLDNLVHAPRPDGLGLSPLIRQWLDRALQISGARIASGADARAALDELLQQERSRDARRLEPLGSEPVARDMPKTRPVLVMTRPSTRDGEERSSTREASFPDGPVPSDPPSVEPPTFDVRALLEADPRPADVLTLFDEEASVAEIPGVDSAAAAAPHPVPPTPAPVVSEPAAAARRELPEPSTVTRPDVSDARRVIQLDLHDASSTAAPLGLADPPAAPRPAPVLHDPHAAARHGLYDPHAATRPRLHDPHAATPPRMHDAHAATRPVANDARLVLKRLQDLHAATRPRPLKVGRWKISTSMVAALVLIAVGEMGVIALMARALWFRPQPPIAVETAASGENVLVSSRSTEAPPIRLTVAPDLRWVRVTAPSDKALGGKGSDAPTGIVRISSPIELKVLEHSRLLGSVPGDGLKLAAGRHDIELVNLPLGYRLKQAVDVEAGGTVSIHVAPPAGSVTIDASPWAEVTIDGRAAGRTPLGPLPLTPGEHDVAFMHPAGGNDRQRVTVRPETKLRVVGKLRR